MSTSYRNSYRLGLTVALFTASFLAGCLPQSARNGATASSSSTSTPTPTTSASASTVTGTPYAVQIITASGTGGSFTSSAVPASGGTYVKASRVYDLNGNLINTSSYPTWWYEEAGVFLTSTSTSFPGGGAGATTSSSANPERTPCAYFDTYSADNNPETNGSYTIDGVITNPVSLSAAVPTSDVDQCASVTAAERAKIGVYVKIRRGSSYMNSTDKIQMIVKAKPLTPPNTAPVPSSCIVSGMFDATACATNVFTVAMRTGLGAAARPFMMVMPSAKSLDLVSESIMLPINIDSNITHVTLDRLKGGAVIYSITLIRIP